MNTNRWISSKQHIGQTKIRLLCKITGAGVMVCLFNPSENMNRYVQGVYIEVKIHTLSIPICIFSGIEETNHGQSPCG